MISRKCHHVTNTFFFPWKREKVDQIIRCRDAALWIQCSLLGCLLHCCNALAQTVWSHGHHSPRWNTDCLSCSLISTPILKGKDSHQQSPQLCSVSTHCHSLQNKFVYCYRMQDKDLKSTPVTELHLNKHRIFRFTKGTYSFPVKQLSQWSAHS